MVAIPKLLIVCSSVSMSSLAFAQNSALFSSLYSECITFIPEYPPTVSLYASKFCHVCQGLSLTPSIEPCCSNSNPTACFASSFYSTSLSDATIAAPITVAPASFTGSANCDAAFSILEGCENATPGFDRLCFHDQQSCYCSTSGTWAPNYYDNYWSSCLAWASISAPSSYSLLGPNVNGVVQSRKCQTWAQLTATGGSPSNCQTSAPNTLSPTSIATPSGSNLVPARSTGEALRFPCRQVGLTRAILLIKNSLSLRVGRYSCRYHHHCNHRLPCGVMREKGLSGRCAMRGK